MRWSARASISPSWSGCPASRPQRRSCPSVPTDRVRSCMRRGASARWRISPEAQKAACQSKVLHLGGVGSLLAMDGAPSVALLRDAKAAGCITTLDLIQARSETLALVEPLLPYVDFFMPSIDETHAMVGTDDPVACAQIFIDKGAGACAISLGENGSFVMTREGRQFTLPAFEVAVRDTSGCGDSYTGGFIAGLVRDWDLLDCARLATATAAIVATGLGSGANLVSFEDTVHAMNTLPVRGAGSLLVHRITFIETGTQHDQTCHRDRGQPRHRARDCHRIGQTRLQPRAERHPGPGGGSAGDHRRGEEAGRTMHPRPGRCQQYRRLPARGVRGRTGPWTCRRSRQQCGHPETGNDRRD